MADLVQKLHLDRNAREFEFSRKILTSFLTSMEAVDHTNCIHDNFGFIHSFEGLPISDLMPKFGSPKPHWSGAGALQPNGVFLLSKTLKGFLGPLGDLGKKLLWYTYAPWGPLP